MRSIVRYGAIILLAAAFLPRFEFTRGMRAAQSAATQQRAPAQPVVDPDGQVIRSERQSFRIEVLARGVETPWGLAFLPDGRLLITERPGRLRILAGGKLLSEAVAGTPAVWERQDGGLFDVEVHPRYAENGWIYLSYSEPGPNETSMTAIVRGRIRDNRWVDQQFIFHAPPELYTASNIHYGSRFLFDKQGSLFYSIGDRGKIDDAQDLSKPAARCTACKTTDRPSRTTRSRTARARCRRSGRTATAILRGWCSTRPAECGSPSMARAVEMS